MNSIKENQELVSKSIENAIGFGFSAEELDERVRELINSNNAHWRRIEGMAKGYVKNRCGHIESYSGKYGEGIRVAYPNRQRRNSHYSFSNRYYVVEYIVMD